MAHMKDPAHLKITEISVGKRLQQERLRLRISQEDLAEALGVTARTISRWEHDQAFPYASHQKQLCRVFGADIATLFGVMDAEAREAAALPSHNNVPYRRNPFFTGRQQLFRQLHAMFDPKQAMTFTNSCALIGLGGIGKTQIALEYIYRYAHQYAAIFWIAAETQESLLSSFASVADLLNPSEKPAGNHCHVITSVQSWFHAHRNWLLVFDNVEDFGIVKPFLPVSAQGSLLLTTRLQALGEFAQRLDIEQMMLEEGIEFLLRRAKLLALYAPLKEATASNYSAAAKIVEAFGSLPLALDQAGAYIEEIGCSLHGYYTRYCQHKAKLLQRRGDRAFEHPQSVMATFALAIQLAGQADPAAIDLLYLLAFLYPYALTEEALTTVTFPPESMLASLCADFYRLDATLATLQNYSLVRRYPEKQLLVLHLLVQEVVKAMIDEEQRRQWEQLALEVTHQMIELEPHLCRQI